MAFSLLVNRAFFAAFLTMKGTFLFCHWHPLLGTMFKNSIAPHFLEGHILSPSLLYISIYIYIQTTTKRGYPFWGEVKNMVLTGKYTTSTRESYAVKAWRGERGISLSNLIDLAPTWNAQVEFLKQEADEMRTNIATLQRNLSESLQREAVLRRMDERIKGTVRK